MLIKYAYLECEGFQIELLLFYMVWLLLVIKIRLLLTSTVDVGLLSKSSPDTCCAYKC